MGRNEQGLDEVLSDFSAVGQVTWLTDPVLRLADVATEWDELGLPHCSLAVPDIPVALVERHQALWASSEDG